MIALRTYGCIFVSAGISVSGVLWYMADHHGVHGEDLAACTAAVTERSLVYQTGTNFTIVVTNGVTNAYNFAPNVVQGGVTWKPLYDTVLCGSRDSALADPEAHGGICWITVDDTRLPADDSEVAVSTTAIAPFVSLGSRIGPVNGIRFVNMGGISTNSPPSLTNFPLTVWLWGIAYTNEITDFSAGASPWTSGNWWTELGFTTNVYLWGCERPVAQTVTTNTYYRLTAENTPGLPAGDYEVGDFYSYSGMATSYTESDTRVYVCPSAPYPLWYIEGVNRWDTGATIYSFFRSAEGVAWPNISRLKWGSTGRWLDFEKVQTFTTNAPMALNKGITTNNLTEARTVMTALRRTVNISPGNITATNLVTYVRQTWFASGEITNDLWIANNWGHTGDGAAFFSLYNTYVQTVEGEISATTNGVDYVTSGTVLAEKPWPAEVIFSLDPPGEFYRPARCVFNSESYLYQYNGCRVPDYPSEFAYVSNYVARVRVYVIVSDVNDKYKKRWYLVCDKTNPTTRPVFSIGGPSFQPSAEAWPPLDLTSDDFAYVYDGDSMAWQFENNTVGWNNAGETGNPDIHIKSCVVVVDWNWTHFGDTEYEPEPYVPPWAE